MATATSTTTSPLLPKYNNKKFTRCQSRPDDELRGFRCLLRWLCLDQSTPVSNPSTNAFSTFFRTTLSYSVFFLLSIAIPSLTHFYLAFRPHRRPYDLVVQFSLTAVSAVSFITTSTITRRFGLRRFLFLDKLAADSDRVRLNYTAQLGRSLRILSYFVLPCFAAELAYKIWWYIASFSDAPYVGHRIAFHCVVGVLELASWLYRTVNFLLVCVLFRLICHLQILRLQDFVAVFQEESEVENVLSEHLRIRRQLKVISHRFRGFILLSLVLVTVSQFAAMLVTLRPNSDDDLFNTGELALSSIVLLTGLLISLRSAAKITHKAQAVTSHAAQWHACATIDSFALDPETPDANNIKPELVFPIIDSESTSDEEVNNEDELEVTKFIQPQAHTISFQKRQALVTYLENNRAGITIFGFTMDRTWLHTVFMLEVSLFLWLLSKTIGIS